MSECNYCTDVIPAVDNVRRLMGPFEREVGGKAREEEHDTTRYGKRTMRPLLLGFLLVGANTAMVASAQSPYPPSSIISDIRWDDESTIFRMAAGSDNWPITWGDDDQLYTAFGDGWGFAPLLSSKAALGTARVTGNPPNIAAENLATLQSINASSHKATGMLMVDGVLYMWTRRDGGRLWKSMDRGGSWQNTGVTMELPNTDFHALHFLQFGANYAGARDSYVYVYGTAKTGTSDNEIYLFRVAQAGGAIENPTSYEYFAGISAGEPIWSSSINDRAAILTDPNHSTRDARVVYHPYIQRYLLTYNDYNDQGFLGLMDAPEPWGPWTTVHYSVWDQGYTFEYTFPQKWMFAPTNSTARMYMVYSGTGSNDAFVVRGVSLTVATDMPLPPTAVLVE